MLNPKVLPPAAMIVGLKDKRTHTVRYANVRRHLAVAVEDRIELSVGCVAS